MEHPKFIYGTAWKKERTADLVVKAVKAGFRGIDTACQPKHYHEHGVGQALIQLKSLGIPRESLFIQTKFTPLSGQDPDKIPYNPRSPLAQQVTESFATSQRNLGCDQIDSWVLHSPLQSQSQLMEVWRAMESVHQQGGARILGISNCYDLDVLRALYDQAHVPPSVLQNRFYGDTSYDVEIRDFCANRGITYQSFWSLTANPHLLSNPVLRTISQSRSVTAPQIFFRFLTQLGIAPLTGTTSEVHMKEDLEIFNFVLSETEMTAINQLLA
jgi:diketogulonate reductase-like aldo/keto reductase